MNRCTTDLISRRFVACALLAAAASASLPTTMRRLMSSNDAQEGVRAMLERRPGDFKGD